MSPSEMITIATSLISTIIVIANFKREHHNNAIKIESRLSKLETKIELALRIKQNAR